LPLLMMEGTPQPSPSRTASALPANASEASSGREPQERRASNAQSQGRAPRPSGLGRFFSKITVPGDSVAPEVWHYLEAI